MSQWSPNQFNQRPPVVVQPRRRRIRRKFRWAWITVPVVVLGMIYLISGIDLAFSWSDVTRFLGVENEQRYGLLVVLGLIIVGIVAIVRVLRHGNDKDET